MKKYNVIILILLTFLFNKTAYSSNNIETLYDVSEVEVSMVDSIEVTIFPNPINGGEVLTIESSDPSPLIVQIFNPNGKEVVQTTFFEGSNQYALLFPDSTSGVYTVRVTIAGEVKSFNIVVSE